MVKPVLYVDLMSQPSRACVVFCRVCGIDVDLKLVKLGKKEQRLPQFLAINPLGKVPTLQEGDFVLPESAAILRYLSSVHGVPAHWYPDNTRRRAKVDAALDWQHANVRGGEARLVFHTVLTGNMGGPFPSDATLAKAALGTLRDALRALEEVWLARTPYVAGDDITIADLLMCCELEQLAMLRAAAPEVPREEALLAPHPRVRAWRDRVAAATAPHYQQASQMLHHVAAEMESAAADSIRASKL